MSIKASKQEIVAAIKFLKSFKDGKATSKSNLNAELFKDYSELSAKILLYNSVGGGGWTTGPKALSLRTPRKVHQRTAITGEA